MKPNISNTKQELAQDFSGYLATLLASKETAHIALSGGSTPKVVFDELAENFTEDIDWGKIHLYWGDERCVPPTNADSNYKMTMDHLISKISIPDENIHRIRGEADPRDEAERYAGLLQAKLPKKNGVPQFDLVILGMGDDGHTASIFPHEIGLWHSKKHCEVAVHPDSGQKRISITGSLINHAAAVAFLVTGENKAEKVGEILGKRGNYQKYPASLVHPKSGGLLWFLDKAAAQGIV